MAISTSFFDAPSVKVLPPARLAHVVLRTANLKRLQDFYIKFLGGELVFANDNIAFTSFDEEHHRIALISVAGTLPKAPTTCGLEHIAFTYNSLQELLLSYRQRKERGILPVWSVNHGPTTSIYYRDPDGNMLETQIDNFETAEEATSYMRSDKFLENPIGTDFDPELLISRLCDGESERTLRLRVEIGPRAMPDLTTM